MRRIHGAQRTIIAEVRITRACRLSAGVDRPDRYIGRVGDVPRSTITRQWIISRGSNVGGLSIRGKIYSPVLVEADIQSLTTGRVWYTTRPIQLKLCNLVREQWSRLPSGALAPVLKPDLRRERYSPGSGHSSM